MSNERPITPPPELVQEWWESTIPNQSTSVKTQLCAKAAQWGADQELEACCEWLSGCGWSYGRELRAIRRPNPPSLKEQALETLNFMESEAPYDKPMIDTIRRALEALDD
jgi:hypothetical protein